MTMTTKHPRIATIIAVLLQFGAGGLASAAPPSKSVAIGTAFPDHFPVIGNFYLGKPVIGFGSDVGRAEHVPVIFLHGNNDSPFPTACNPFGRIQAFAQFFLDHGYHPIAGRSTDKLQKVRTDIDAPDDLPLVKADAAEPASLRSMCERASVIITAVGPYQRQGSELVAACYSCAATR